MKNLILLILFSGIAYGMYEPMMINEKSVIANDYFFSVDSQKRSDGYIYGSFIPKESGEIDFFISLNDYSISLRNFEILSDYQELKEYVCDYKSIDDGSEIKCIEEKEIIVNENTSEKQTIENILFSHSGKINGNKIEWTETHIQEYKDQGKFVFSSEEFEGYSYMYINRYNRVESGKEYFFRFYVDVPVNEKIEEEYLIGYKYSDQELQTASLENRVYAIDPAVNSSWLYHQRIEINSSSPLNLTNRTLHFTMNTSGLISLGLMNSSCKDIRITNDTNETLMEYIIENRTCNTNETEIWFNSPNVLDFSQLNVFYVYYGNPYAESIENASATFKDCKSVFMGDSLNDLMGLNNMSCIGTCTIVKNTSCKFGYCIWLDKNSSLLKTSPTGVTALTVWVSMFSKIDQPASNGMLYSFGTDASNSARSYYRAGTSNTLLMDTYGFDGAVLNYLPVGNGINHYTNRWTDNDVYNFVNGSIQSATWAKTSSPAMNYISIGSRNKGLNWTGNGSASFDMIKFCNYNGTQNDALLENGQSFILYDLVTTTTTTSSSSSSSSSTTMNSTTVPTTSTTSTIAIYLTYTGNKVLCFTNSTNNKTCIENGEHYNITTDQIMTLNPKNMNVSASSIYDMIILLSEFLGAIILIWILVFLFGKFIQ